MSREMTPINDYLRDNGVSALVFDAAMTANLETISDYAVRYYGKDSDRVAIAQYIDATCSGNDGLLTLFWRSGDRTNITHADEFLRTISETLQLITGD